MTPSNDVRSGPAKAVRVGLRRGTRYYVAEGERMSEARVLERDIEVVVGDLRDVFNVFARDDGETIFARVEDEIHDPHEDSDD